MAEMEADKIALSQCSKVRTFPHSLFLAKAHCLGYSLHLPEEAEEQG